MESTIKKLQQAVQCKISDMRESGEPITLECLQELLPMIEIANALCEMCRNMSGDTEPPQDQPPMLKVVSSQGSSFLDDISKRLDECERLLDRWVETQEDGYKSMARDQLKHSEFFINLATKNGSVPQNMLKDMKVRHNRLLAKII